MCDASRVLSTATVLRDVFIVALGVHVVVVLTWTPLVNEESTPMLTKGETKVARCRRSLIIFLSFNSSLLKDAA